MTKEYCYYGTLLVWMITLFAVFFVACFCLNYVYRKHHVFVEKRVTALFTQRFNALRFVCACKQKQACKQCRIWFGVYSFFGHPYHRLTSYFKFEDSQDTQALLDTIAQSFKIDKFVVKSETHYHNSLLLEKRGCRVRISLHPLMETQKIHTQYRLICTWIPT
jgi:hypothetical protein